MLLRETGFKATKNQRFNIYLTNSLEEHHPETGTLFANWLSSEANEANHIKRDTPVMVVMGNPPYSVSSTNKSEWIENLMQDYKKDLNERNIQPLSDDYIKFIRYGQHFIEKNGEGILAYISNNSFIDGLIHRQMRKSLLETFDKIYILDLHGNSKKKEVCEDGRPDQNVFDIMQGVSINIFVKSKNIIKQSEVFHFDEFGKRENKYQFLQENNIQKINWKILDIRPPEYLFRNIDHGVKELYNDGFKVDHLFNINSSGIKTHRDHFVIDFSRKNLQKRISKFFDKQIDELSIKNEFKLKNNRDWSVSDAREAGNFDSGKVIKINYRPFDIRYCYYDENLIDFDRKKVMQHFIKSENLGFSALRQSRNNENGTYWVHKLITGKDAISILDTCTTFPLYIYPEQNNQPAIQKINSRSPNLNIEIVNQIVKNLGLTFVPEKEPEGNVCMANNQEVRQEYKTTFAPIDLLDY
ncbi:MAG: type ISP restriction/modification enzyme, partial [Prolixibacteraceae bacterium]